MRCQAMDTGPDGGRCEEQATAVNSLGHHLCAGCFELSEAVMKLFNALAEDAEYDHRFELTPPPWANAKWN